MPPRINAWSNPVPAVGIGQTTTAYTVWKESNDTLIRDLKGAMNDLVATHASAATRPNPYVNKSWTEIAEQCEALAQRARHEATRELQPLSNEDVAEQERDEC